MLIYRKEMANLITYWSGFIAGQRSKWKTGFMNFMPIKSINDRIHGIWRNFESAPWDIVGFTKYNTDIGMMLDEKLDQLDGVTSAALQEEINNRLYDEIDQESI